MTQGNQLFRRTRFSLAIWYAGVMGLILGLLGIGVYKAIAHAHWVAIDRELESVTGTIHDSLELKLTKLGSIDPIIYQLLPNLCLVDTDCKNRSNNSQRHILSAIDKGNYYIRIYNKFGKLIAIAGNYPDTLPSDFNGRYWQNLQDDRGNNYHQISLTLHTKTQQDWGYFQVGRSLQDFEDYLAGVSRALQIGLPISLFFVALASWYLAGLAMQPIYRSYRQIEQFTADAAHELRTPLASIQATIESALLDDLGSMEAVKILDSIDKDNRRLIQLVADLLFLTRIDTKDNSRYARQTGDISDRSCCLNDLIEDLVEELQFLAIQNQIELNADIRTKKTIEVVGNGNRLYRLVYNLITNAIQYTPAKGSVMVSLTSSENYASIKVKDTGIGIAPEQQKKIFDRFYRVDEARSRHMGGSGLGLAIAASIARSHGGSLKVESELEKGSVFIVKLPLNVRS